MVRSKKSLITRRSFIGLSGTSCMSGLGIGRAARFVAPILMYWGQSNSRGRDATFTNFNGPSAEIIYRESAVQTRITSYPYAATHGLELSSGDNLELAQGGYTVNQIKCAVDGSSLVSWLPGGSNYALLTGAVVAAMACSPLRQVAFLCQQGETEALGAGSPTTYQADFIAFMTNIRALFGPEYTVKFYVVPVNPNCPSAPNLASIISQQTNAVNATANAVLVTNFNSINPALDGGLHYGLGQTLPMGDTYANIIRNDYKFGLATYGVGIGTDTSISQILGSKLVSLVGGLGATSTLLPDQSGNGWNETSTGLIALASDSTLSGAPTVNIPTTSKVNSSLIIGQASVSPICIFGAIKLNSSKNQVLFSSGFNNDCFVEYQLGGPNALESFNGNVVSLGFGNAENTGVWQLFRSTFTNSSTDWHGSGRMAIQGNAGNLAASGVPRTQNGYSGSEGNFWEYFKCTANADLTPSEWNRIRDLLMRTLNAGGSWNTCPLMGV